MPPKKERDEALTEFTSRIFSSMMEEILLDVVLQSHQELARARAVCNICHTRCGSVHVPGGPNGAQDATSTRPSPPDGTRAIEGGTAPGTGVNTPTNGTVYFDCSNCGRSIAYNRYAPHLSSCMGLGTSRRIGARNSSRIRMPSDAARSDSPYAGSENGHVSDDGKAPAKSKFKSKSKRDDEAEFSIVRKRTGSPSVSPIKKSKKQKTGSAITRVKTDPDIQSSPVPLPLAHTTSQTKIPSKLRESSILSSLPYERRSSSPGSSASSPAHSASTPSVFSVQSPLLNNKKRSQNGAIHAEPATKFTQARAPSPPINRIEQDYLVDVDGDETGSSTDSDSS